MFLTVRSFSSPGLTLRLLTPPLHQSFLWNDRFIDFETQVWSSSLTETMYINVWVEQEQAGAKRATYTLSTSELGPRRFPASAALLSWGAGG